MLDKDRGCTDESNEIERMDLERLKELKVQAYAERNRLVCALSKLFPSHLNRHPDLDKDWDNDWRWIVCIHGPAGQMSWHIHDSELSMFEHLHKSEYPGIEAYLSYGYSDYDGHTTEDKYKRLERISAKL